MTTTSRTTRSAVIGTVLTAALVACGSTPADTAGPAATPSAGRTGSPAAADAADTERITPRGIAVVVRDQLGARAVRRFTTFHPEPGSVSVMVRLREGGRGDNFAVTVSSPRQARELGSAKACPPDGDRGRWEDAQCRILDDGTMVTTSEIQEGFSDDNADGVVAFGTAVNRESGAAMAMYESYDDTPAVSAADLDRILADRRLTWLTDPSLDRSGGDIRIEELDG